VEAVLKRVAQIEEAAPGGGNDQELANSLNNLARFYRESGDYGQSEALYKKSLSLREKVFGPDHPSVAASLRNYAALLRKMNRLKEAQDLDSRAEAIENKFEASP
jgi:tetratricopeptide (TPR) repeat protein